MALIVVPELPLSAWFLALDDQLRRAANYFINKPVVVNLAAVQDAGADLPDLLAGLEARGLRLIAVEGASRAQVAGTKWADLPDLRQRSDNEGEPGGKLLDIPDDPLPAPSATSLIIDKPVRSGQAVIFEQGDVVVLGAIASGAEVIAGGSIHVYGALRGRAIAGLHAGAGGRIFCRKLGAELVAIDGVYDTAEDWDAAFNGRAVQIRLADGRLTYSALD